MQEIGALSVTEAVRRLNSGSLTSRVLVAALSFRAGTVGLELRLITESNFAWALRAAAECDQKRRESGKRNWTFEDGDYSDDKFLPPLFGIPVSIKDMIDMKGLMTTWGALSKLTR